MNPFAETLKTWRKHRGYSQLDLSTRAEVSSRHLSFLESGRARPSRNMVLKLGQVLAMPLREQNQLLQCAGYAAQFSDHSLDEKEMSALRSVLDMMLLNHQPFPAIAMDASWNLVTANPTFERMQQGLSQNPDWPRDITNAMELTFHPHAYKPYIKNWNDVASLLLQRLQHEYRSTRDQRLQRLWHKITQSYPLPDGWQTPVEHHYKPYIHTTMVINGVELRLLSTITVFGTATDITAQELRIEQFYPLDEQTRQHFSRQGTPTT